MQKIVNILLWLGIMSTAFTQIPQGSLSCAKGKIKALASTTNNLRIAQNQTIDDSIDVKYYKLDLDISYRFSSKDSNHYGTKLLKGIVSLKAASISQSLQEVKLNLKNEGLQVDSVFVDQSKQAHTHQNDLLLVDLGKTIPRNELFTIMVYYQGVPSAGGFGSFTFTTHGDTAQPMIYSLSEPFGAADWFPCKNTPNDKADSSDVWITAPKDMVSVSNGLLEEVIEHDSTKTYKWKSRYPIANYLISFTMTNFEQYHNTFNDGNGLSMPVDHYVFPEYNTEENRKNMDETLFMLETFSQKFGPYPFLKEKYGHANFTTGIGGMEHQTCSSVSDFSNGLVAHELAHQWFGDKITCTNWENIWLNEGFASYGEVLYGEYKNGKSFSDGVINSVMNGAKNAVGSVYVEKPTVVDEIFNTERTYFKGASVLHMLRRIVGDETFFQILKQYLNSVHAYGNACTEDFQSVAENVSGLSLDYFFKQWIYGYNHPHYQFGWATKETSNAQNKFPVYFKINQMPNAPSPTFFTMPITLRVNYKDSSSTDLIVFNNRLIQDSLIYLDQMPTHITFDPDSSILKNVSLIPTNLPDSLLNTVDQLFNSINHELTLSPNPAREQFELTLDASFQGNVSIQICSASGSLEKTIWTHSNAQKITVACADLKPGLHLVKVYSDQRLEVQKLYIVAP